MTPKTRISYYNNLQELSLQIAFYILETAQQCVQERDFFTLVLAGGNTPRNLYECLSTEQISRKMPWEKTHIFWGDERWVSHSNIDSNFAMAFNSFISKIDIPDINVHGIPTSSRSPNDDAINYENELRDFFQKVPALPPIFDCILLGMGEDGHTASLFPGSENLKENERWIIAEESPVGSPPVPRITMTLPVLKAARNVIFLISGKKKVEIVREILDDQAAASQHYPAAMVNPTAGYLTWALVE